VRVNIVRALSRDAPQWRGLKTTRDGNTLQALRDANELELAQAIVAF
jgi:hypothetical protein